MMTQRNLFLRHVAQTSDAPLMLEIVKASGIHLFDVAGKKYIDLISGISVSNLGHCHPKVVEAVQKQAAKYMYLMVYGEYVYTPQLALAHLLSEQLPESLDNVYFVNSGSEAVEGALKLAKRYTGRTEMIGFRNAYHGSTHGALSVLGDEYFRRNYRPLLPDVRSLRYNNKKDLLQITERTACVIAETVQAEAGLIVPQDGFLQALRQRCTEVGALLILDEIQVGFGRTGSLFAFEQFGVVPDILLLAKGMGGGMPIGAFVASTELMSVFKNHPVLGHITTFGGHPVCCAASLATLQVLLETLHIQEVKEKEALIHRRMVHPAIKAVRSQGLLVAVELESYEFNKKVMDKCVEKGVIIDWFLFASHCFRMAPPLIITEKQLNEVCDIILESIDEVYQQ